jgi:hypothetical protein
MTVIEAMECCCSINLAFHGVQQLVSPLELNFARQRLEPATKPSLQISN